MSAITFMYAVPARGASKLPSRLYRKLIVNLGSQQGKRSERTRRDTTRLPAAIRPPEIPDGQILKLAPIFPCRGTASVRVAEGAINAPSENRPAYLNLIAVNLARDIAWPGHQVCREYLTRNKSRRIPGLLRLLFDIIFRHIPLSNNW